MKKKYKQFAKKLFNNLILLYLSEFVTEIQGLKEQIATLKDDIKKLEDGNAILVRRIDSKQNKAKICKNCTHLNSSPASFNSKNDYCDLMNISKQIKDVNSSCDNFQPDSL